MAAPPRPPRTKSNPTADLVMDVEYAKPDKSRSQNSPPWKPPIALYGDRVSQSQIPDVNRTSSPGPTRAGQTESRINGDSLNGVEYAKPNKAPGGKSTRPSSWNSRPPRPPRGVTEQRPGEEIYDAPRPGARPVEQGTLAEYSLQQGGDWVYDVPSGGVRPVAVGGERRGVAPAGEASTEYNLQQGGDWLYDVLSGGVGPAAVGGERRGVAPAGEASTVAVPAASSGRNAPIRNVTLRRPLPLTLTHSTKVEDDKIKVVLELKSPETRHTAEFSRAPMRLVCLFDISGSMIQKCGSKVKGKQETKLQKMINVAKILTETLDETDHLGILAFGGEVEVLWPMTQNDQKAKERVLSKVDSLGKDGLSLTTNLSQAMMAAIDTFRQHNKKNGGKPFSTRDVIVVLTDGDINDGLTDGQTLVREVRKAIRELEMEGRHYSRDPSLTVSTVVTGNNVSEAVYLLSKTCGSDAYYYVDKSTDTLELGAIMPILLRKTSAASSISVKVQPLDPAEIFPKECSHEYMAHRPHEKDEVLNYFIHDIGLGMCKHLLVVLDKESVLCETDQSASVLHVEVAYYDRIMEKHFLAYEISRGEILPATTEAVPQSIAVSIQDIRRISQIALRDAADFLKADQPMIAASLLLQSQLDVQEQAEKFSDGLGRKSEMKVLNEFVKSVTENLGNLLQVVEDCQTSTGESWSAAKALSSAIVREAPSAPKLFVQEKTFTRQEQPNDQVAAISQVIRNEYSRQGVKSAIFYDFDVTLTELRDTLQRGTSPNALQRWGPPAAQQRGGSHAEATLQCDGSKESAQNSQRGRDSFNGPARRRRAVSNEYTSSPDLIQLD